MLKILTALVTAVLAAAVLSAPAVAAPADVVTSCTNAGCPDPVDWSEQRWKAHAGYPSFGGTLDGMNCTNYVAWRMIKGLGFTADQMRGLGNAAAWDTNAAKKGYKVTRSPAVGAIAQWDSNHVAFVEQVNSDGTIVISESNVWVGTASNRKWLQFRTIKASSVDHFIHLGPAPLSVRSIIAPGDFDGDGHGDLLSIRYDGTFKLFAGDGAGGFLDPAGTRIGTGWQKFKSVFAPGDFSGDHKADILSVATDGRLYLYRGNGAGKWSGSRTQIGTGWNKMLFAFSPGDFSGDGTSDAIGVKADGRLVLYQGNGKGGWKGSAATIATGFQTARRVASAGDFDGDGKADVIAIWPDGTVKLYRGNGSNGFIDPEGAVIATGWTDVGAFTGNADVSGDGFTDLTALRAGGEVLVYEGDGTTLADPGIPLSVTW